MGREDREAYDSLKKTYRDEEKKLQRVGANDPKRVDVLSSLLELCDGLSDFCGLRAVSDEDEDKRDWWMKQSNSWKEKHERWDRELDETMEDQ
ncbi:hypothetical protein CNMCM5793_003110 [Aspergillus hiratsukae]|uniref:Uncharacterized protein n=1 Tax=Aspergillus hiratsukae TaxID=1194566 RepID=A0A8H6UGY8_9EURO|nr:hypothetical protein CNMCM5793_003110 [Aspergillus hiratsukae]KAF7168330.1 hypothetical protein CNMCM6106_003589 [Aspergillus hiratsukae]